MVSRQETARPLLTPGEVMQLPPTDELVLVSGVRPIRARKVRFYEDRQLQVRVSAPPAPGSARGVASASAAWPPNGWTKVVAASASAAVGSATTTGNTEAEEDAANGGIRREPELPEHVDVAPEPTPAREFEFDEERDEDDALVKARALQRQFGNAVRQAPRDPGDGLAL